MNAHLLRAGKLPSGGHSLVELVVSVAILTISMAGATMAQLASRGSLAESRDTNIAVSALRTSIEIALLQQKAALVNDYTPGATRPALGAPGGESPQDGQQGYQGEQSGGDADDEREPDSVIDRLVADKQTTLSAKLERLPQHSLAFRTPNYDPDQPLPAVLDMAVVLSWVSSTGNVRTLEVVTSKR